MNCRTEVTFAGVDRVGQATASTPRELVIACDTLLSRKVANTLPMADCRAPDDV